MNLLIANEIEHGDIFQLLIRFQTMRSQLQAAYFNKLTLGIKRARQLLSSVRTVFEQPPNDHRTLEPVPSRRHARQGPLPGVALRRRLR